jgi:autotransporter-associated beta strand protein
MKSTLVAAFILSLLIALAPPPVFAQTTVAFTNDQVDPTDYDTSSGGLTLTIATGTATQSGAISGTGSITKSGAGTLTLTANNTFSGGAALTGGTLALGSSGALGSGGAISFNGGTLQFSASNTTDYSGRFSTATNQAFSVDTNGQNVTFATGGLYSGSTLTKLGAGTLTLSAVNSGSVWVYLGDITISAGTLYLQGNVMASQVNPVTVAAGATLRNSNTGTGYNTIYSLSGAGTVQIDAGGRLKSTGDASTTFSGTFSDAGDFTKYGTGTLTLSGDSSLHTGNFTLAGGTLQIGNGGTTGSLGSTIYLENASPFPIALVFNRSDDFTVANAIYGAGNVTKLGAGTLTITGQNSYTGNTTVSAGTLQIGAGGTSGSLASNIINNAQLTFNRSDAVTYAAAISGAGELTQAGSGTLILSGANTYTGTTTVSAGTLQIGAGGTSGSIASGSVVDNGALVFNRSDALTYAGNISGSGTLKQSGGGTLTLSGANSQTGGTTLAGGTLALGSSGALGSGGAIAFTGGTLQFSAANTTDYSGRFSSAASQAFRFDTNGQNVTLGSPLVSAGGTLNKSGAGTLTLAAANTFSGVTTISAGTLLLGHPLALQNSTLTAPASGGLSFGSLTSATFGGLSGFNPITLANASSAAVALTVANNSPLSYANVLSGPGTLT